jgi:hypothetical protein
MQEITGEDPPVLAMLRAAYRATREALAGLPPTGIRWKRPARTCPSWCAGDHRCTARPRYPSGEHRSPGDVWRRGYGRILATRALDLSGRTELDLTIRVRLSDDGDTALAQGISLPLVVDGAILTCLAEVDLMIRHRTTLAGSGHPSITGARRPVPGPGNRQLPHRAA